MTVDGGFGLIAALLLLAAVLGILATRLRQPLLVAFIVAGLLAGPAALGWVEESPELDLLAELGIALLLFVVGLKLDLKLIRTTGPVALATGLGQVVFTSGVGYGITRLLGYEPITALYVAVALTFSSTIIIVKLLSDKQEIDSLHGRIAVGFLIVQDIVVVIVMIALTAIGAGEGRLGPELVTTAAWGVGLLVGLGVLARWVLPRALQLLARSPELLVIFSIAWAAAIAALSDWMGLSTEVGAFLAGVALASTPYRETLAARLASVRDFLLLFFFVDLGARMEIGLIGDQLAPALLLSAFVLVGNPLIVMIIMGLMGYRRGTGFLAGLTVAQISEFSLILTALGVALGHITDDVLGLVTIVGLITITASTYLILGSHQLLHRLSPYLGVFERREPVRGEAAATPPEPVEVVVVGVGRLGGALARRLAERGVAVLGVDADPQVVAAGLDGAQVRFGDAEDPELPRHLPLERARWVVCTSPWASVGRTLAQSLEHHDYRGRYAAVAHRDDDAEQLLAAGVDKVIRPFELAAMSTVNELAGSRPD